MNKRGVAPPPHSPSHETLSLFGDIFHWQAGVTVDAHRMKRIRTKIGMSTGSLPQPHLVLVSPASWGSSAMAM
jgi:hypothetical protein